MCHISLSIIIIVAFGGVAGNRHSTNQSRVQFVIANQPKIPVGFEPATANDALTHHFELVDALKKARQSKYEVRNRYVYMPRGHLPILIGKNVEEKPRLSMECVNSRLHGAKEGNLHNRRQIVKCADACLADCSHACPLNCCGVGANQCDSKCQMSCKLVYTKPCYEYVRCYRLPFIAGKDTTHGLSRHHVTSPYGVTLRRGSAFSQRLAKRRRHFLHKRKRLIESNPQSEVANATRIIREVIQEYFHI